MLAPCSSILVRGPWWVEQTPVCFEVVGIGAIDIPSLVSSTQSPSDLRVPLGSLASWEVDSENCLYAHVFAGCLLGICKDVLETFLKGSFRTTTRSVASRTCQRMAVGAGMDLGLCL